MDIKETDDVVEFASGIGSTASLIVDRKPRSYTGVEINEEAVKELEEGFNEEGFKFINKSATKTGLKEESYDKVIAEAMLTMQTQQRKSEIIKEAYRILKPGGLFGIHELGLKPDDISEELKAQIQGDLSKVYSGDVGPLTQSAWGQIIRKEGFKIKEAYTSPMTLLESSRLLEDEGIFGALKIQTNLMANSKIRNRVKEMHQTFRKYEDHLTAFAIIAEK